MHLMKAYIFLIITLGLIVKCNPDTNDLTKLDSDDFKSAEERIKALKSEIKYPSDFNDAEFELFNVNGFHDHRSSAPGPSSWDYKFVIKIDTVNIAAWTNGLKRVDQINYDKNWTRELIENRKQNWLTNSAPEIYVREGEEVILYVFRNEGIIYKRLEY